MNEQIAEYMRGIGSKGGKAGTGKSKRRGDSDFYKRLTAMREAKREKLRDAGSQKVNKGESK